MERFCPLVILDYRVVVYNLYYQYQSLKASKLDKTFLSNWLKASWALIIHRGPTALPYFENHRVVVVSDSSPYWKTQYLADRGFPQYKGGRPDKTDDWYEVNSAGIAYLTSPNSTVEFIEIPGYEADDITGALVRLNPGRMILLHTIDSDWQGLVDDGELRCGQSIEYLCSSSTNIEPTCIWFNLREWSPRIRDEDGVRTHTLKRTGNVIDKPRELWQTKVHEGDKSDNLIPGSPIEVIDLLAPPAEFDLLNHEMFPALKSAAQNPLPNSNLNHLKKSLKWFQDKGFNPPLFGLGEFPINF